MMFSVNAPEKILRNLFFVFIALLVVSGLNKDKYPQVFEILPELYIQPLQTTTQAVPFKIIKKGLTYNIVPVYNYELYGMVVSYHHSSSWSDYYHQEWKDYLNYKDIGLIWGSALKSGVYHHMKFKSGSWTLYWQPKNRLYRGPEFRNDEGSNNHVLSNDPKVTSAIMNSERGDQIYMKGYLVNYSNKDNGSTRNTSTVRSDSGCEVVYVTDFKILKKANVLLRLTYKVCKYGALISFLLLVFFWYKRASSAVDETRQI